jgi:hypothetical protein
MTMTKRFDDAFEKFMLVAAAEAATEADVVAKLIEAIGVMMAVALTPDETIEEAAERLKALMIEIAHKERQSDLTIELIAARAAKLRS